MNTEERKIDCRKYSECLAEIARIGGRDFSCFRCVNYEKPGETRVDEWEEGLTGHGARDTVKRERGEEGMRKTLNVGKKCSVDGCDRDAKSGGMCWMHFRRKQRGADMLAPRGMKPGRKRKEKEEKTPTDNQKPVVRATGKERGSYKPKGPKKSEELRAPGRNLLEEAVDILIQCGFLKKEKLDAAMELVKE